MLGQTSPPGELRPFSLQVEPDEAALSQDEASQRNTRFLWTGFGLALLMLIGLSARALQPLALNASAKQSLRVAFSPVFVVRGPPSLGPRGIAPGQRFGSGQARNRVFYPAAHPGSLSARSAFSPKMVTKMKATASEKSTGEFKKSVKKRKIATKMSSTASEKSAGGYIPMAEQMAATAMETTDDEEPLAEQSAASDMGTQSAVPGESYPPGTEFDGKRMRHLGKGKFGDVWEATDLETGERNVVKFFYDKKTNEYLTWNKADEVQRWTMLKNIEECKVVKELVSTGSKLYPPGASHICACKDEQVSQGKTNHDAPMYTVWEMAGKDDLTTMKLPTGSRDNIRKRIRISQAITKEIVEVLALLSMFNPPIIHHDLKGENVVVTGNVDEGFDVKIIDFGCFLPASQDMTNSLSIGDPKYMPPEHSQSCAFANPPSSFDMYSVGLIHMELLCPELKHDDWWPSDSSTPSRETIMQAMEDKCPELFAADMADLMDENIGLIRRCLRAEPERRPVPMYVVERLSRAIAASTRNSAMIREETKFKQGDSVEMLIDMKWVKCVVAEAAAETYEIEYCDDEGYCNFFFNVDPAHVKAAAETPLIVVPDVRPGSNLPGMQPVVKWYSDGY